MTDQPVAVQVVELPIDRLRRLGLAPDIPRSDLWEAIAAAVTDISERAAAVRADAAGNRRVMAQLEQHLLRPPAGLKRSEPSGDSVQPG